MIGVAGSTPVAMSRRRDGGLPQALRHRRQRRHRLMLEHRARRDHQPGLAGPADQLDRHDAVAAQLEEVVVDADPLQAPASRQTARTAPPRAACAAAAAAPRPAPPAPAAPAGRACRSASAAADPAPRTPTAPCSPAAARDRCARSAAASGADAPSFATTYATRRSTPPLGRRRRIASRRGAHHAACATRPACRMQRRLDLARLDAEAAQLHLRVRPPQELQHAIARASAPGRRCGTSGCPPPRTDRPRTAPPSAPHAPDSPAPDPAPATYNSPATPAGTGCKMRVQHVDLRVPDRTTDRDVGCRQSSRRHVPAT